MFAACTAMSVAMPGVPTCSDATIVVTSAMNSAMPAPIASRDWKTRLFSPVASHSSEYAATASAPITAMNGLVATYPPAAWLLFLYLGLGVSVLGYVCLVLGLRTMPVTRATIVSLLEPLTGVSLAWVLFGERLGISGVLGGALLLIAMGIVFRGAAARPPGAPRPARAPLA